MGAFLGYGRRPSQFRVDRTVHFCQRTDDFLWGIFGDDLGRVAFSIGVFENEPRFARFNKLAVGRSRKEQTGSRDRNQIGGEGTGFRHKACVLSSRIAASATGFFEFFNFFVACIDPVFVIPTEVEESLAVSEILRDVSTSLDMT